MRIELPIGTEVLIEGDVIFEHVEPKEMYFREEDE